MERRSLRRATSGALAALILAGCNSSPFKDLPAHEPGAAGARIWSKADLDGPREGADDAELPVLDSDSVLADYLLYAGLNNPGLEAAFQRFRASAERLPQVRALPDPRLTFGVYLQEVETAAGPMNSRVGIAQTFPWFGRLQDQEDAAARDANAAWRRYQAEKLDLFERVTTAVYELRYLHQAIRITEENLALLRQFEQVALARFRVGAAEHPDVIRIQVELGALEDRLAQLNQLRDPYTSRLNAALNRPVNAALPWPGALPAELYAGTADELFELVREYNPRLLALAEEVERERELAELARKQGLPDLTVGLDYTFVSDDAPMPGFSESGKDPILLNFSLNLPLDRSKYDAAVREAVARRLSIASARAEQTNRLGADLRLALFEHVDAERRVELYGNTLIPKATESMQASLAGFRTGDSDFLDVLDTERTLLEFQLAFERAVADRAVSLAKLERLTGTDLDTNPVGGAPDGTENNR